MTRKINTIPPKRLAETITAAATSFKLNDILGFDDIALTESIVGDTLYCSFQDTTGRYLELMKIDTSTIADASITILARGLSFNEDGTETEVAGNKRQWIKNQTIVNLGTDTPAMFNSYVKIADTQTINGVKTFGSIPVLPASDPTTDNQAVRKAYADTKLEDSMLDTDTALTANSDAKIPSQKAVKAYADTKLEDSMLDTDITLGADSDSKIATQKATKAYADNLAIAGSPVASETSKGIVEIATQAQVDAGTDDGETGAKVVIIPSTLQTTITQLESQISYEHTLIAGENLVANNLLYQKESDGKAYKVVSTMLQSDMNRIIGFATGSITSGDNVTVNRNGVYSGLSGLTAGKTYYIGTTAGSISITDTVAFRAYCVLALSTTTCIIVPTTFENMTTTASATSPLKFSNDTSMELGGSPSTTYFKTKEILVTKPLTNAYVRATGRTTSAGAGSFSVLYLRLYKNGVAIGTEVNCGANGSSGNTADAVTNLAVGDLLQIYVKRSAGDPVGANSFVENFRMYYDVQDEPPYNATFTSNS